ncbi:MAG: hypothetical protein ACI86M_003870 [Saprospiraceae bacterium]|jgi:hypothetical protein
MKNLLNFIPILLLALTIASCGEDDNQDDPQSPNQFEYQEETFTTQNAAMLFYENSYLDSTGMDQSEYDEEFTLILTDGDLISNDDVSLDFSLDTKQAIFLTVDLNDDSTVDALEDINLSNIEYDLTDDTEVFTNISIEIDPGNTSNTGGSIDYNGSTFVISFADTDQGTVVFNDFNIDFTTNKGTIDCTYSIMSEAVGLISGQYKGDFIVVVD